MVNVSFLKEALATSASAVQLIVLSQKQLRDSLLYTMTTFLAQKDMGIVYVTLTQTADRAIDDLLTSSRAHMVVVDAFSRTSGEGTHANTPITFVDSPSNLTGIQIGIENALHKLSTQKKLIVFDSLNALALYNQKQVLYKFLYIFSNKMKLREQPCLFFITRESTDTITLDWLKRFCDETFDYSGIQMSTVQVIE